MAELRVLQVHVAVANLNQQEGKLRKQMALVILSVGALSCPNQERHQFKANAYPSSSTVHSTPRLEGIGKGKIPTTITKESSSSSSFSTLSLTIHLSASDQPDRRWEEEEQNTVTELRGPTVTLGRKVWSMSGGPNCRPKHWRRNTAIAMFGIFLICIPIAMKSAELEVSLLILLI
ncbi:hypothetical protein OIU84_016059 [Salix udensis]|uniref:Uncharacterized protein n=1 Tax=Salix udensis TaxID=889485 RepID=A0AAD6J8Q8_9ROSI|nr:hypothetical protein OIU84_016059 [Salix udensis]